MLHVRQVVPVVIAMWSLSGMANLLPASWIRLNTMPKRLVQFGAAVLFASVFVVTLQARNRRTPLVEAVQQAQHSVVNIHSEKTAKRKETVYESPSSDRKVNGMGSGIVIDERGYIVTNYHVVHRVDALRVTLVDGSTYSARVISFDKSKDLAIIKINASRPLKVMEVGTSSDVMLAETVFAVGNAFGYEHTVTSGIVSALSRDVEVNEEQSYERLIQTDASINPGNSGGPLLNLDGEVVGINVAIRAGAQRIGFAIPIDDARRAIARLISSQQLSGITHGILARDQKNGADHKLVVKGTFQGGPAATAGLKVGDQIIRVGATAVSDGVDLERAFIGKRAGESINVVYNRDGATKSTSLVLARGSAPMQNVSQRRIREASKPDDKLWTNLGMRITGISAAERRILSSRYRGGMKVVAVRPGSSSDQSQIMSGDILLGLEGFETLSQDNVAYVLNEVEQKASTSLEFYVYRNGKLMKGWLTLASATR